MDFRNFNYFDEHYFEQEIIPQKLGRKARNRFSSGLVKLRETRQRHVVRFVVSN